MTYRKPSIRATDFSMCRVFAVLALCLTMFQTSKAQEPNGKDLCEQLSTLIEASKTGFVSLVGDVMDEKKRVYVSKLELSGFDDGFVQPEDEDGPFVLYVSIGGNNLSEIKKRYNAWVPKLRACLPGWKRTQTASSEEVASVFRPGIEGPSIQLDYNIEPSKIGDTKYDLYLTFKAPSSVVEKNLCGELSTLVDASRSGFGSILGAVDDEKHSSYISTLKLTAWGSGWVYPKADDPHVLYVMLGSNRLSEVKSDYSRWVSKLTTCLPGWKRTQAASAEEVESVFKRDTDGPSIELEYNVTPSKTGSTKYDLYLMIHAPRVKQTKSP